jgi:phenylacetate-CoA ligase
MERGDPAGDSVLANTIEEEIKKQILVSGKVEILDYGTLPRSERKSKRVFDHRGI